MKHFFYKLTAFFLVIAATLILIEFMLRQVPNDYRLKREFLDKNSDSIEVLFLGSSHAFYGINPAYTKKRSFNAAYVSQTLDYNYEILRKYRDHWSSLEYIVLTISYPSLYSKLEDNVEGWRIKNYVIYYDIKISNNLRYYAEIMNGALSEKYRTLYNYYFKKINHVKSSDLGWGVSFGSGTKEELVRTGIEAAERNTIPTENQNFEEMTLCLDSIIEFTKMRKVKLIMLTTPVWDSFIETMNQKQIDSTIRFMNNIGNKTNDCYYFNWLNDKSFTSSEFSDGDHLNANGARKLTLRIDSIINKLEEDL